MIPKRKKSPVSFFKEFGNKSAKKLKLMRDQSLISFLRLSHGSNLLSFDDIKKFQKFLHQSLTCRNLHHFCQARKPWAKLTAAPTPPPVNRIKFAKMEKWEKWKRGRFLLEKIPKRALFAEIMNLTLKKTRRNYSANFSNPTNGHGELLLRPGKII